MRYSSFLTVGNDVLNMARLMGQCAWVQWKVVQAAVPGGCLLVVLVAEWEVRPMMMGGLCVSSSFHAGRIPLQTDRESVPQAVSFFPFFFSVSSIHAALSPHPGCCIPVLALENNQLVVRFRYVLSSL